MKIIEAINKYFGYEVKDIREFREAIGEDYPYHMQTVEVFEFLRWVERQESK